MDLPTLILSLVSLTAAIVAGIAVIYKRHNGPKFIKKVKQEKNKPLMQNPESLQDYWGRQLSALPYAIGFVVVLVLLAKCGVV